MLQSQAPEELKRTRIITRIALIITTGPEESPGIAIAQGLVGKRPLAPPNGATLVEMLLQMLTMENSNNAGIMC